MRCPYCGSKLKADAKFCTECGHDIAEAESIGSTPHSDIEPPLKATRLGSQVSEIRGKAKRKMPLFMLVVLVALGIATLAFAVAMLVQYVFASPNSQRQQEPTEAVAGSSTSGGNATTSDATPITDTAATPETATAETIAATTSPASPAAPASEPTNDSAASAGNTTAPEAANPAAPSTNTVDPIIAQQAVFNDILGQYKAAQDRGWTQGDESELFDIQELENGAHDTSTISYAFVDLGNDGYQDLVVAKSSTGDGEVIYGIYLSDGTKASPANGFGLTISVKYMSWKILTDGTILNWGGWNDGSMNQIHRTATLYSVSNGALRGITAYEVISSLNGNPATHSYSKDGQPITEEEWQTAKNSWQYATLDWHPLSGFTPVG